MVHKSLRLYFWIHKNLYVGILLFSKMTLNLNNFFHSSKHMKKVGLLCHTNVTPTRRFAKASLCQKSVTLIGWTMMTGTACR